MLRSLASFARLPALACAVLSAALLDACCSCPNGGSNGGPQPLQTHYGTPGGPGGPPQIHGRVSFDSANVVYLDLQVIESGLPRCGFVEVWWANDADGGSPVLFPVDPQITFTGTPSPYWNIYMIPANYDPDMNFHVKVGLKQNSGASTYMTGGLKTQMWPGSGGGTQWDNIDQTP